MYEVAFAQGLADGGCNGVATVPVERFTDLRQFAMRVLGPGAVVFPGPSRLDHLRTALQLQASGLTEPRRVFTQTGWRVVAGQAVFLHAGGAIGAAGAAADVEVALSETLSLLALPPPPEGDDLCNAVQASLSLLEVAPGPVMAALLGPTEPHCPSRLTSHYIWPDRQEP